MRFLGSSFVLLIGSLFYWMEGQTALNDLDERLSAHFLLKNFVETPPDKAPWSGSSRGKKAKSEDDGSAALTFDPVLGLYYFNDGSESAIHPESISNPNPILSCDSGVVFEMGIPSSHKKIHKRLLEQTLPFMVNGEQHQPKLDPQLVGPVPESFVVENVEQRLVENPLEEGFGYVGQIEMDLHDLGGHKIRTCIGSACQTGAYTLITAAHNVYSRYLKRPFARIILNAARAGDHIPYTAEAITFVVHPTFMEGNEEEAREHDIALVLLDTPLGHNVGCATHAHLEDKDLMEQSLTVVGYPGMIYRDDKWETVNGAHMTYMEGPVVRVTENRIFYNVNTASGQSGGGVFTQNRELCGIHAYSPRGSEQGNSATRLSSEKMEWVREWEQRFISEIVLKDSPAFRTRSSLASAKKALEEDTGAETYVKKTKNAKKKAKKRLKAGGRKTVTSDTALKRGKGLLNKGKQKVK